MATSMIRVLTILALVVLGCRISLHAQSFNVNLSQRHVAKINSAKSGYERLKKYRKFYSRDSSRQMKRLDRSLKRRSDSLTRMAWKTEKLRHRLEKEGKMMPADTMALLKNYVRFLPKDTTALDSALVKRIVASGKNQIAVSKQMKQLQAKYGFGQVESLEFLEADSSARKQMQKMTLLKAREKAVSSLPAEQRKQYEAISGRYGPYSKELTGYVGFLRDSADVADTLRSLALQRATLEGKKLIAERIAPGGMEELKGFESRVDEVKGMQNKYLEEAGDLSNPDAVKKGVEQKVFDKVATKADKLMPLMSKLKNKYSFLPNSNDVSTAVKAKSLQGRPIRERWVIGGNFNIASTAPLMVDLSPQFGYKIDRKFQVGVGLVYRAKFVDSVRVVNAISPVHYGHSTFVNYGLILNFFGYAEWERTAAMVKSKDNAIQWVNSLLLGVGRTFKLHPKVSGSLLLLYNPLHKNGTTPYHDAFVIKTGFQLSELALIKK